MIIDIYPHEVGLTTSIVNDIVVTTRDSFIDPQVVDSQVVKFLDNDIVEVIVTPPDGFLHAKDIVNILSFDESNSPHSSFSFEIMDEETEVDHLPISTLTRYILNHHLQYMLFLPRTVSRLSEGER